MDFYTDNTNLAYDLSRFDTAEREKRVKERREAEEQKIKMAPVVSVSKSGSKFKLVAVVTVLFLALFAVTCFKVRNDDVARSVTDQQMILTSAKDDNALLQSKLDAIANIGYIEKYAAENLGMTKVTASQKNYLGINIENLIEADNDDSTGFIGSVKRWFNSVMEYIGL